ncbi:hypothetical protein DFQ26_009484 [Actinomortierella ambigua]|nr:hypothetical protein DFQ26_009484 [Actinomortierella ambigua]
MAWRCSGSTNEELIQRLAQAHLIATPTVRDAMLAVDRKHYSKFRPYEDAPQTIGYGATISAPHMHAAALEALLSCLDKGAKVLDVGSGSGYLTTCIAHIVGPEGRVVGGKWRPFKYGNRLDHIPELVEKAKENVRADNAALLDSGRVRFEVADGRGGFPGEAPYDCIHVGAAAENMPKELINQLKAPGRMFIPVGPKGMQAIFVVDKDEHGKVTMVKSMDVMYVPLTDAQKQHPSGLQHGEL